MFAFIVIGVFLATLTYELGRLLFVKMAKFHITVPGSIEWQDRVFNGIIEQSGRDHIIVSNPNTGEWYLILMIY